MPSTMESFNGTADSSPPAERSPTSATNPATSPTTSVPSSSSTQPASSSSSGNVADSSMFTPGKMFIGGLSWETTDDGLRAYFSKYGEIVDSVVMRDPVTGRSRGFGFVTFAVASTTDRVLAETHVLDGKTIDPKPAIPRELKPTPLGSDFRTKKLFVGGVAPTTTEETLRRYFGQFGVIAEALLMTDRDTGRPRGFGFITFDTEEAAELACQQKFHEIDHKSVEVKKAEPKSSRSRLDARTNAATAAAMRRGPPGAMTDYATFSQYGGAFAAAPPPPPPGFSGYGSFGSAGFVNAPFDYQSRLAPGAGGAVAAAAARPFSRGAFRYVANGVQAPPIGAAPFDAQPGDFAAAAAGAQFAVPSAAAQRPPNAYALYDDYYMAEVSVGGAGDGARTTAAFAGYAVAPPAATYAAAIAQRPPRFQTHASRV